MVRFAVELLQPLQDKLCVSSTMPDRSPRQPRPPAGSGHCSAPYPARQCSLRVRIDKDHTEFQLRGSILSLRLTCRWSRQ